MFYTGLFFAIITLCLFLVYAIDTQIYKKPKNTLPLIASFITGALVLFITKEILGEIGVFFTLCFALIFAMAVYYYSKDLGKLIIFLAVAIAELVYLTTLYPAGNSLYPFVQMLAIGTAYGVIYRNGFEIFTQRSKRQIGTVEIRRDYVHLLLGVVVLAIFLLFSVYYAIAIVVGLIIIGYVNNSVLAQRRKGSFYRFLTSLERPEANYGVSALYLGVGTLLLIGFIHNLHFLIIGFSALLFADPIATIAGITFGRIKLFYNKRKSVIGTAAFFAVVSLVGYVFVGPYSLLFGISLAIVESVDMRIDDNITIAVFMIFVYILYLYLANQLPLPLY
jgi:dolichol kinase